ncbi:hypothetical protein JB92DRAFT_2827000 [Gautieria morchelliformis]|nr:hypothetical protein JB92DRAFT_2827000 [Gautieria morchelliformis]
MTKKYVLSDGFGESLIACIRFKAKVPVAWKDLKKTFRMGGALSPYNQSVVDFEFVPGYNLAIEICNWCWDGVPQAKKGLFRTHSSRVGGYLEGTPVVVDASTEPHSDVSPALIMKRVRDASGAKYSVHNEATRSADPIAPVGTNSICGALVPEEWEARVAHWDGGRWDIRQRYYAGWSGMH